MKELLVEIVKDKKGNDIYKVNGLLLHSKYNSSVEAEKLIQEQFKINCAQILFGYGNGYFLDALLKKVKDELVIVVDPLIENGLIEIQERHIGKAVYWSPNQENTLGFLISKLNDGKLLKINVISSLSYKKLFAEELKEILLYIKEFQNRTQVNYNTEVFFSELWQRNFASNIFNVVRDHSLLELKDKFEVPIILVAGGPSLTKQIPLLKEIKENVIIIAAGSTVNSLMLHNIEPDFVISIDGGEPNYEHFKGKLFKHARLIYSPYNHPKVRESFEHPGYVFSQIGHEAMGRYLYKKFGLDLPIIAGGGTVAHYGITIANLLNSGPIAMIGQDLAYTNNQTHAEGNKHAWKVNNLSDLNKRLIETEGYYNDKVQTSEEFLAMKMVFEEIIQFHVPRQPIYNCTEGGVKLKGFNQLSFEEFINKYVTKGILKQLEFSAPIKQYQSKSLIIKTYKEELNDIYILKKKLYKGIIIVNHAKKMGFFTDKQLRILEKIDKEFEEKSKMIQIHFLIAPIIMEIMNCYLPLENETEVQKFNRTVKQTERLYQKLIEALETSRNNIINVIEKEGSIDESVNNRSD